MTSFMTEPLLTGLGAGGYMLVSPPGGTPVLLDFMVAADTHTGARTPLDAVVVDFGDAVQVFHIGAASCGVYGVPAGIARAAARFGSVPLEELAPPPIAHARDRHTVHPGPALVQGLAAPQAAA